jgi:hypothetical protein
MAYNEKLYNRIREALASVDNVIEQQKFGGISFMINDKMCVRVDKEDIMLRCEPEQTEELLLKRGARRFEMKGKPMMKGWLLIGPEGTNSKKDFDYWMLIALDYNKKIKPSKKK